MKRAAVQAGLAASKHRIAHHWQGSQSRIRDQQGARHAKLAAPIGQLPDAAGADLDGGGVVPVD
ncbi:hypothetical protein D3C72_2419300 [compost metagenome]